MTPGVLYVGTFLSAERNRSYCEDLADRLEAAGTRVVRTSARPGRIARLADIAATAWRARADYDVAIVDVFSGPAFLWAEAACLELRLLGKPYILTLHGGRLPELARRWPRRVRRLLRSAAAVTAPSPFMREHMRAYRADITVIANAIDTSAFRFHERARPRPHLVWLRAFHALYNPRLAIDVLAALARRIPDVTLTMVGPDKGDGTWDATRAHARELGAEDRVRWIGGVPRTEVAGLLDSSDIFINTTDVDNTPLSLLEAAASGLCVVSTNVGGIPFLLADGRNALLVPPRDAGAMTAAIDRVLGEPGLAPRLSSAARTLALAHDWTHVLARWAVALDEAVHA